jgi:hypothetical protein
MNDKRPHYLAYLLRLWQTSDGERQIWRASLERPGTGERQGFAGLNDLFSFLLARTESEDEWSEDHEDDDVLIS